MDDIDRMPLEELYGLQQRLERELKIRLRDELKAAESYVNELREMAGLEPIKVSDLRVRRLPQEASA